MFKALGYGKGNTVLAAIAFAIGCPAYVSRSSLNQSEVTRTNYGCLSCRVWLFWVYGKTIREISKHAKSK